VQAVADPTLVVSDSDPASPFRFPFSLSNRSWLPMQGVTWTCSTLQAEIDTNNLSRNSYTDTVLPALDAGATANHICTVISVPDWSRVHELSVKVDVSYKTLWFVPRSYSAAFTWIADGSRSKWIPGTQPQ
jgi:hypothetical protein